MVGSVAAGSDRSKEAVGMMALHEALRAVCVNSDWAYSVFWTIRPRPRSRGGNGCKVSDENGSLMLMWEDGFCKGSAEEMTGDDLIRKAFSKMSIQLYNYGEGLMGKVASDKCHKWVFKEPSESEPNISNYWQSSFDALPPEWTDQFNSGIQTIAVIQAGHGLLQLGSCKIIPEDLHFVLRMRHTFESLGYQSGFYLSQLFSSTRSTSSTPPPHKQVPPPPIFNWNQRPMPGPIATSFHASAARIGLPTKDETHLFLLPQATDTPVQEMVPDHDSELKWPTGLSVINALTGRSEDSKLLFGGMEALGDKPSLHQQHTFAISGKDPGSSSDIDANKNDVKLSPDDVNKVGHKYQRSTAMPSTSSSTMDSRGHETVAGIYSDMMGTF